MALTPAMEDYLEAILMIKQQHGYVRCVDVAEQLGVKKPSVSRAVKELINFRLYRKVLCYERDRSYR